MAMTTRELLHLRNTGHAGINALFAKAHSADWDFERDVDWSTPVAKDESLVSHQWTAFGRTPTFQALPDTVKSYVNRRGVGRILNILQVGESVAQDVCAKIGLAVREEDYRNHAAAQAMDEARHHLAYRRFLEKMDEEVEDIDTATEMMFDNVLRFEDPLRLIAAEQFFLEGLAMNIFESIEREATNPLLKRILFLITRDESRHMGFGVLYVERWLREHSLPERIEFARVWLPQILFAATDRPGPLMLQRVGQRMREAGVDNVAELAARMLREQEELNAADLGEIAAGRNMPHLLKNARRVGLFAPEILEAFALADNPIVQGALRFRLDA